MLKLYWMFLTNSFCRVGSVSVSYVSDNPPFTSAFPEFNIYSYEFIYSSTVLLFWMGICWLFHIVTHYLLILKIFFKHKKNYKITKLHTSIEIQHGLFSSYGFINQQLSDWKCTMCFSSSRKFRSNYQEIRKFNLLKILSFLICIFVFCSLTVGNLWLETCRYK